MLALETDKLTKDNADAIRRPRPYRARDALSHQV